MNEAKQEAPGAFWSVLMISRWNSGSDRDLLCRLTRVHPNRSSGWQTTKFESGKHKRTVTEEKRERKSEIESIGHTQTRKEKTRNKKTEKSVVNSKQEREEIGSFTLPASSHSKVKCCEASLFTQIRHCLLWWWSVCVYVFAHSNICSSGGGPLVVIN